MHGAQHGVHNDCSVFAEPAGRGRELFPETVEINAFATGDEALHVRTAKATSRVMGHNTERSATRSPKGVMTIGATAVETRRLSAMSYLGANKRLQKFLVAAQQASFSRRATRSWLHVACPTSCANRQCREPISSSVLAIRIRRVPEGNADSSSGQCTRSDAAALSCDLQRA